jgi:hypothetical protein
MSRDYKHPKSIKYSIWDTKTDKSHEIVKRNSSKKDNTKSSEPEV